MSNSKKVSFCSLVNIGFITHKPIILVILTVDYNKKGYLER